MSLIFGINLCDRLYLSGDTRLSQKNSGALTQKKDKIAKVVPFTNNIVGVFAGNADMSAFMARKLLTLIESALDIRSLRRDIRKLLAPLVDEYWRTIDSSDRAKIVIIFGGLNPSKKKQFNLREINDKIRQYANLKGEEQSMNMKPALFNEVMRSGNQPLRYPEPSDSLIFSVQIFPPTGFLIEDAEWGEYLAYGPNGMTKEKLKPITLGMIEFSGQAGDPIHDNMAIVAILRDVAEVMKENTIGETFVNMIIKDGIVGVLGGGVFRANLATMKPKFLSEVTTKDGKLFSKNEDSSLTELISIKDYSSFGNLEI